MIGIVDYGAGNLRSVQNAFDAVGAQHWLLRDASALDRASKIVLPGVGHLGQMMRALDDLRLREKLLERIATGVPFLGICLGLQALFERSVEAPDAVGLGLFSGTVERFAPTARVPHMGWNTIHLVRPSRLIEPQNERHYYFANSYFAPVCEATSATCDYTLPFSAAVESSNVFGVQFHPEKSGSAGLGVIRRFATL